MEGQATTQQTPRDDDEQRESQRHADAQMWRIRWFAMVFALAQIFLYKTPPGLKLPFRPAVVAPAIAVLIVSVNVLSLIARRIDTVRAYAVMGSLQLGLDCILTMSVVWLYSFDNQSALWALLIIVVIEGAIRAGLLGAISTWAGSSVAYVIREIWTSHTYSYIPFRIDSITYRLGIVLIVAAATGYLARNLRTRVDEQRTSREDSEQRAGLLHTVAGAARTMTTPDPEGVLKVVVDAAIELGFDASTIALIDPNSATFRLAVSRGVRGDLAAREYTIEGSLVRAVLDRRDSVTITSDMERPGHVDIAELGIKAVVACPIWVGIDIEAVMLAASTTHFEVSAVERESLDLLSLQAGAALTNAHRFRERKELEKQLEYEAFHDPLTGLANRALFLDRLDHCLERKERNQSPTALLFVDLDGFKRINDSLGHDFGDNVLRAVARRLHDKRRVGDTVARWGGDEFTILIEEPRSEQAAVETASRIIEDLRPPFKVQERDVYVTASIGIAYGMPLPGSGLDFLREADVAMYRAKEQGGSGYEAYTPTMLQTAQKRMDMELELRRAFETGAFSVEYQPAVSIDTRRIVGLEALVRWNHPTLGRVLARDFITLAEERDMIGRLGTWVLDAVGKQIRAWVDAHPAWPFVPVAINLSPKELRQADFVDQVKSVIDRYKLEPERLAFEVTERALIDTDETVNHLSALRSLGMQLAVDDFGLGYSSLTYLKRFPFTVMKIDQSFVAGVTHDPSDQAIVRSLLTLAKDLGIAVVAEGVETPEQLEYLREMGCDYVQGYHIHRPLLPDGVVELVMGTTPVPG